MGMGFTKTSAFRRQRGKVIIRAKVSEAHVKTVLSLARRLPKVKRNSLEMMAREISWQIPQSENIKVNTVRAILVGLARQKRIKLPQKSKMGGPRNMKNRVKK
jgi:hypothetical protein